jgi:uncharacterized damage-inducible protein DinB
MERLPFVAHDFASHDIGLLAAALENATREWRGELAEVDEDAIVWQAWPNGHSIGALILHIADVEAWWIETVAAGKKRPRGEARRLLSEETEQYGVHSPTPPRKPLSWYFAIHDAIRARSLETLRSLDDADRYVSRVGWKESCNVRWIVSHVVSHESYHGGQAVLLNVMRQKMM